MGTINAASVGVGNVEVVSPAGAVMPVTFIGFTPATGAATYQYQKTWGYLDNGVWSIRTSNVNPVLDDSANPAVAGAVLGNFTVNIATPADVVPPTGSLVGTIVDITTAGALTLSPVITWTD